MAAVSKWRTLLNEKPFCKILRENNREESKGKIQLEAKNLLLVKDNDLFIWDNKSSHLIYFNWQNLIELTQPLERQNSFQVLMCTNSPNFDINCLVWNLTKTQIALWGRHGVAILELPQKWGQFSEFQGGTGSVLCKCISIGEHYFSSHNASLLQVSWHPASSTDTHVVFLTSDNQISIYDILEPDKLIQTIYLGDNEPSYGLPHSNPSISLSALGDNVVAFDFAASMEIKKKSSSFKSGKVETVWPICCVRGNGDIVVALTDLTQRLPKLPIQGPLLMYPPAEDNYGTDACAILCLQTTPSVIVISTCDGRLHHCILLPRKADDVTVQQELSFRNPVDEASLYQPEEMILYVRETIELELSLTKPQFEDNSATAEIFTCPIRLVKDLSAPERYHCAHAAGIHTVVMPWIHSYQRFFTEDDDNLPRHESSIVEHLICTKPLPTSEMRYIVSETTMTSSSTSHTIPSPLRKISREAFDDIIRRILHRDTSIPRLSSGANSTISQQQCFQLLSRTTQVFREEYIQKQDLARQEIKRRVMILKEQKVPQESDLQHLQKSQNILSNKALSLGKTCEECKEKQEDLLKRIENVMRKLQARIPFLSNSEKNMKKELEAIEDRMKMYQSSLEQLRVKKDYQQRQIKQSYKTNQPSPVINSSQIPQLREVLKKEGDDVFELMKKLNQLKMEVSA